MFARLHFVRRAALVAVAVAASLVGLAGPARGAGQPLTDNIPPDALVYFGWQGAENLQGKYDKSNLKHVVDASKIPQWIGEKQGWVLEQIRKESPEGEAGVKLALSVGEKMWKHPTALYVGPMDLSKVDNNTPPTPRIALICQAGADADALVKELQPLIDGAKNAPVKMTIMKKGDKVAVGIGEFTPAQKVIIGLEDIVGVKTLPVTAVPEFNNAMAQVDASPAISVYIDMQGIAQQLEEIAKKIPEAQVQQYAGPVLEAVNLRGMTQVAMSGTFTDKEWVDRAFVGLKGPKKGVTIFFDNKPLADDAFKAIPKDAVSFEIIRLDLARIYDEIRTSIKTIEPGADRAVTQAVGMVQMMIGIEPKTDVLDTLGDTWTLYHMPATADGPASLVAMVTVKDEKKLKVTIKMVEDLMRERGMPLPEEKAKIGDAEASVVEMAGVELAWGVSQGRLIISTKDGFTGAINQLTKAKDSILDNANYVAVRKALGGGPVISATFNDPAKTYPEFAKGVAQLMLMAKMYGVDLPNDLFPEPKAIAPYLTPGGGISYSDDKGYHTITRTAFPGATILAGQMSGMAPVAVAAAGVAILLPSLGRSRELSDRSYSAANLRGIAQSANIWAADHADNFPEHPAQLIAANMTAPKQFVSKRHPGTTPATFTADELKGGETSWKPMAEKLDEHNDYVIDFKGMKAWVDATLIIGWEKPEGLADGINVAFSDAHVEFVRFADLKRVFDASNKARVSYKLPPIEFKDGMPVPPK